MESDNPIDIALSVKGYNVHCIRTLHNIAEVHFHVDANGLEVEMEHFPRFMVVAGLVSKLKGFWGLESK